MIVAAGEDVITKHIIDAMPDCPSVKKLVSVGPDIPEGCDTKKTASILIKRTKAVSLSSHRYRKLIVSHLSLIFY